MLVFEPFLCRGMPLAAIHSSGIPHLDTLLNISKNTSGLILATSLTTMKGTQSTPWHFFVFSDLKLFSRSSILNCTGLMGFLWELFLSGNKSMFDGRATLSRKNFWNLSANWPGLVITTSPSLITMSRCLFFPRSWFTVFSVGFWARSHELGASLLCLIQWSYWICCLSISTPGSYETLPNQCHQLHFCHWRSPFCSSII